MANTQKNALFSWGDRPLPLLPGVYTAIERVFMLRPGREPEPIKGRRKPNISDFVTSADD